MNDDLDEEIIGSEEGFDEFVQKNTLGDAWRNNPAVKIGVVLGVVVLFFGAVYMFGKKDDEVAPSQLPMPSEITSAPGASEASPAYIEAVEEENEATLEKAIKEGDSAIPVPVDTPSDRLQLPEEQEDSEDPLHKWRRLQEERVLRDSNVEETEPVTVLDSEKQNEAMKEMAQSMMQQIQSILNRQTERIKFKYEALVRYCNTNTCGGGGGGGAPGAGPENGEFDGEVEEDEGELIIPAGEIEYAQLIIEANSDVPGPVLALLMSGPLKGSKLLGTFSVQNDYLTLQFNTLVHEDETYDISAIALDPDTSLPGMATEVDHRYLQRILLPAAAAFVEGFADAIAQTDATSITIDTSGSATSTTQSDVDLDTEEEVALGVKEAGEEVRDILDEMSDDVEVLVKIHAGTPMGVLFTDEVREEPSDT